jgi:hypothetical protein
LELAVIRDPIARRLFSRQLALLRVHRQWFHACAILAPGYEKRPKVFTMAIDVAGYVSP